MPISPDIPPRGQPAWHPFRLLESSRMHRGKNGDTVALSEADLPGFEFVPFFEATEPTHEQLTVRDLRHHVHQLLLDQLNW